MNPEEFKKDFENLDISIENIENVTVKEVIKAYRKRAIKVHPDKNNKEEEAKFNELMKELNKSYEKVLRLAVQNAAKEEKHDLVNENEEDDEEKFMKDNFENFNFPQENNGSFTVIIQDHLADAWQECLERIYGEPNIKKNNRGTLCDRYWKFSYDFEGKSTELTMHIYNKPKTKTPSKIMIQGGIQINICMFVFNMLPQIYKEVCKIAPEEPIKSIRKKKQSMVSCDQCKVKATLIDMKMHLKTAHSKPSVKLTKQLRSQSIIEEKMLKCDNCAFKAKESQTLIKHIDAIHQNPWSIVKGFDCKQCDSVCNTSEQLDRHIETKHSNQELIVDLTLDEISQAIDDIQGYVEERRSPTPIPENIYICAECSKGFQTNEEVEIHMDLDHSQATLEDKIKRLEAELAYEKDQHKDHLNILESTLIEVDSYKKRISDLETQAILKEAEIKDLKSEQEVKEKQNKKNIEKLNAEVINLKKENNQTSEALRLAVLERENLRENDRILLNTLDMMKIYVDKIKDKEGLIDTKLFKCDKCKLTFTSLEHLKQHRSSKHTDEHNDMQQNIPEEEKKDEIYFSCLKCNFETQEEKDLTEHMNSEHDCYDCDICTNKFESNSKLQEHKNKDHTMVHCELCRYVSRSTSHMNEHVRNTHLKTKRSNIPCIYWNYGYCKYFEMCKYSHVEIPPCPQQNNCTQFRCPLYHANQTMNNFLGRSQAPFRRH